MPTCDKCNVVFRGFGSTCPSCRKSLSSARCQLCSAPLSGLNVACADCSTSSKSNCASCGKRVFEMEKLVLDGRLLHMACFKCVTCGVKLSMSNFGKAGDRFFCKKHFEEKEWEREKERRGKHLALIHAQGADFRRMREWKAHAFQVNSIATVAESEEAISSSDRGIITWDLVTGQELRKLSGHALLSQAVSVSLTGGRIAASLSDGSFQVWDAASGQQLLSNSASRSPALVAAIFPSGDRVVICSQDGLLSVLDVATGHEDHSNARHKSVALVAVFPAGDKIVTAATRQALIWDVASLKVEMRIETGRGFFHSIAVFPNGGAVVGGAYGDSGDDDICEVKVWDVVQKRLVHTFAAHTMPVTCVAVFPTCDRLLTGSSDGTAIIWDLATEQVVQTFAQHSGGVTCAAVSSSGDTILLGDTHGNIYHWQEVRKVPLALSLQGEDDGQLRVKCLTLAGRELAEFGGLSAQDPLSTLTTLIHGRIQPPAGARWQPVLPSMVCADDSQLHMALGELFAQPTATSAQ